MKLLNSVTTYFPYHTKHQHALHETSTCLLLFKIPSFFINCADSDEQPYPTHNNKDYLLPSPLSYIIDLHTLAIRAPVRIYRSTGGKASNGIKSLLPIISGTKNKMGTSVKIM